MADNDKSKIRYDDFVSNVQPDPAKPESTIMLSGFVGHGPEGHARVYPDPTLGTWYDIPEDDIVYSTPIADSKLGGSYVWVRASSEIKPGSAAPAATEAVQPQQAAAGMNPTPATHCFVCDPPKAAAAMQPTPTVQTHCFICPPHTQNCTPATVCTHIGCPPTNAIHCPPHTPNCTLATICTQIGCPTHTQAVNCPTHPMVCEHPTLWTQPIGGCPPQTHQVFCPTQPVVCDTMLTPTPATRCFICPPPHPTLATVCTQIGCPPPQTHLVFCPTQPVVCNLQPTQPVVCGVLPPSFGCQQGARQQQPEAVMAAAAPPNTAATLCTQAPACPPHTIHNSICICPTPSAFHPCGHNTLPTVCTLGPPCPPHTIHNSMCICPTPSAFHPCGHNTAATVCTQGPPCPPHTIHNSMCICPTPGASAICTPTIPQLTAFGACPTFGPCPSIACTPLTPIQNGVFTPFGR